MPTSPKTPARLNFGSILAVSSFVMNTARCRFSRARRYQRYSSMITKPDFSKDVNRQTQYFHASNQRAVPRFLERRENKETNKTTVARREQVQVDGSPPWRLRGNWIRYGRAHSATRGETMEARHPVAAAGTRHTEAPCG